MISLQKGSRRPRVEPLRVPYDAVVMAYLGYHCERSIHIGFSEYSNGRRHFTLDYPRFSDGSPRDSWTISALPSSWDWLLRQAEQSTTLGELSPQLIETIETYLSECEKFYDDSDII